MHRDELHAERENYMNAVYGNLPIQAFSKPNCLQDNNFTCDNGIMLGLNDKLHEKKKLGEEDAFIQNGKTMLQVIKESLIMPLNKGLKKL